MPRPVWKGHLLQVADSPQANFGQSRRPPARHPCRAALRTHLAAGAVQPPAGGVQPWRKAERGGGEAGARQPGPPRRRPAGEGHGARGRPHTLAARRGARAASAPIAARPQRLPDGYTRRTPTAASQKEAPEVLPRGGSGQSPTSFLPLEQWRRGGGGVPSCPAAPSKPAAVGVPPGASFSLASISCGRHSSAAPRGLRPGGPRLRLAAWGLCPRLPCWLAAGSQPGLLQRPRNATSEVQQSRGRASIGLSP